MIKKKNLEFILKRFCFLLISFLHTTYTFAQLGFCTGSTGAPIFIENFGSGNTYGPSLPPGVTNYTFVNTGFPNDGQYTIYNRTNLITNSWHFSLDRTPDNEPDGVNGKCLIVNASNTPGQFYKRTVTGLCSNTRFEFSAWLLNVYNSSSGVCPGSGIPINVTFEIWDETDTVLLSSGNTGNIVGTPNPIWNQFGLVFNMPSGQTSAILKMRNNGVGGCGNDLAIDDIMFRACGENSTIFNTSIPGDSIIICSNSEVTNRNLEVITSGNIVHVYQWQQSNDNINFTDISGETTANYSIPNLTNTTYYRVKVAQDIANLNNPFCSTFSSVYNVIVNPLPNAPTSNGDQRFCTNQATSLSVSVLAGETVNWYDSPTNGNLLLANSLTYTPTSIGTYYAETLSIANGCISNTRTPVTLLPAITVTYSGPTTQCTNTNTNISLLTSDANAIFYWTASSIDVTGFSNGSGNSINQTLEYNGTSSGTVTYVVTPILNGCEGLPETIIINVTPATTISLTFPPLTTTYCLNASAEILPSFSTNTIPITGTWSPAYIDTSNFGTSTYTFTPETTPCENINPFVIDITVLDNISPGFTDTIYVCKEDSPPSLSTISPNGINGIWSPNEINNLVSGSYTFTPNGNVCSTPQTISVTIIEPQLISFSYIIIDEFTNNQKISILTNPTGNYFYQLDNGVPQESNVFENISGGIHFITVTEQNDCNYILTKEIVVLQFPKYFTPNGDGNNDYWTIENINLLENWKISIFDRFGKFIIELNNSNIAWNGMLNSEKLPSTDYWFVLEYEKDSEKKIFRSHFSLIR